jgi:hypothetical protein
MVMQNRCYKDIEKKTLLEEVLGLKIQIEEAVK